MMAHKLKERLEAEFWAAIENGQTDKVRELLKQGVDVSYVNADHYSHGKSALHLAVEKAHADIVKLLVDAKANLNAFDKWGRTALYIAAERLAQKANAPQFYRPIIKILLENNADINATAHKITSNSRNDWIRAEYDPSQFECVHTILNEIKLERALASNQLQHQIGKFQTENSQLKVEVQALQQKEQSLIKELTIQKQQQAVIETRVKELEEQVKILGLENNQTQKELLELHSQVKQQKFTTKNIQPKQVSEATKIQAVFRGFMARKKQPLSQLSKDRQLEIKEKSPEVISRLFREGKYDEGTKLAYAIKNEKYHEAIQIIRDIPEKEISINNGLKVRY